MYYTYGHYKADSKELFYIGKGKGNKSHEKDSRSTFWKNIVTKHGYMVEIFARWKSEQDAFIHEKFLIECFCNLTKLCNLTDGGDGCSGYIWTTEQKENLKLRVPSRFGKTFTIEQRNKIRISQLGIKRKPHSKEHSAKIALAHMGKVKSDSHIKKMTENAILQSSKILVCPNCSNEGRGPNMYRYHFKNCKA